MLLLYLCNCATMEKKRQSRLVMVVFIHLLLQITAISGAEVALPEPEFAEPIRNVTTPLGREAILSCYIENLGQYKVGWLRADDQTILSLHRRVVTHNPRISVTHDESKTWNLHIRQVKESDQGCYMCQINTATMRKQLGCIQVQVPPDILDENSTSDITVSEGDNVTLVCKAKGKPTPRIFWRREDGKPIIVNKPSHHISHGTEPGTPNLPSHQRSNQQSGHQNRERNKEVEVFYGEVLRMFRVTRTMMGAYTCIATNDVPPAVSKRVSLNVNFVPLVWSEIHVVGAPRGSQVKLECQIESYPHSINYWLKGRPEENNMLLQSRKYVMEDERQGYHGVMSLIIRDFTTDDEGTYTCVATNSLGKAEWTTRLYGYSEVGHIVAKNNDMEDILKRDTSTASSLSMRNQQNRFSGSHTYYPENSRNLRPKNCSAGHRGTYATILLVLSLVLFVF